MSKEAPQFDDSQRIQDPEKAHRMALAGHRYRLMGDEGVIRAESREEYAGRRYEHDKKMGIEEPDSRIQNPDKAHKMALEGDWARRTAVFHRQMRIEDPKHKDFHKNRTKEYDERAEKLEERAGTEYDDQKSQEGSEPRNT